MKVLLDTHTFLWWNTNDPQLSVRVREIIANGENELFLSAASAWEIAIKTGRGRLQLPDVPDKYVASRMALHRIQPLPIQLSHALQVYHLPPHHADPFDRLLIAQSQLESMPLLTVDAQIRNYDVEVVW
ncbi:MAG TPA: type II toxin-antitoxin system VapC family toxin [Anaerolineales bacterium]|nr:type II toxin-antitoxin system VapC family toxin [Anaerolineales bacterium]